jgi:hypothetical protein
VELFFPPKFARSSKQTGLTKRLWINLPIPWPVSRHAEEPKTNFGVGSNYDCFVRLPRRPQFLSDEKTSAWNKARKWSTTVFMGNLELPGGI